MSSAEKKTFTFSWTQGTFLLENPTSSNNSSHKLSNEGSLNFEKLFDPLKLFRSNNQWTVWFLIDFHWFFFRKSRSDSFMWLKHDVKNLGLDFFKKKVFLSKIVAANHYQLFIRRKLLKSNFKTAPECILFSCSKSHHSCTLHVETSTLC